MTIQLPFDLIQQLQAQPQSANKQHLCTLFLKDGRRLYDITVTNCQDAFIPVEQCNFNADAIVGLYVQR